MKRTEWIKYIDYFGRSIDTDLSKVRILNVQFSLIGHIASTSYVNRHIARQHLDKQFNLEPPKLLMYQLTKIISVEIAPHISSALRDIGVIFDKYILSRSPVVVGVDRAGTTES